MTSRDLLINTAKDLLWSKGYEAMSPRLVLDESGVGQGSLYHHFKSKEELAFAALESLCAELLESNRSVFSDTSVSPLCRIKQYLQMKRPALKGCKIGGLVNESSVTNSSLNTVVDLYFTSLKKMLLTALKEAIDLKQISKTTDVNATAELIMATVQGGYVTSKGRSKESGMSQAVKGVVLYLELLARE